MSIQRFRQKVSAPRKLINEESIAWYRNPSWLAMPATTSSDERVDMLVAVYPESNFIAFSFNTTAGTYDVDWGDGTSTNHASGSAAQKQYTYTDVALNNTNGPVTFQDTGDTVTRTAHGYSDGMRISFAKITSTTGIIEFQRYYVVNSTTNTFQLSETISGTPLTLTTDGTGEILLYKQAIISVTPNTGGATFSTVNLQVRNTTTGLPTYSQPILDLTISANCSSMTISGTVVPLRIAEKIKILRHNTTNLTSLFRDCHALKSVPLFDTSAATITQSIFNNCYSVEEIPLFNFSSSITLSSAFAGCVSLKSVPLFNTEVVTNMSSMFSGCSSLESVPLFNTASVTNFLQMFQSCISLVSVPLFNTSAATDTSSMFSGCSSLKFIPKFDLLGTLNISGMFSSCASLEEVPLFDTSLSTNMSAMFSGCVSLKQIPVFDTSSNTNFSNLFATCRSIQYVPVLNTSAGTRFDSMFVNCSNLEVMLSLDTTSATGTNPFNSMFNGCNSLSTVGEIVFNRAAITTSGAYTSLFNACVSLSKIGSGAANTGPKFTFTVAFCKLSPAALDALYTSLPTVTSQTITVTGNWGTASDTPSIATAKGWTVTGS